MIKKIFFERLLCINNKKFYFIRLFPHRDTPEDYLLVITLTARRKLMRGSDGDARISETTEDAKCYLLSTALVFP